jgi:hypothetical protein
MHQTTSRFWRCFGNLPEPIQRLARKNFEILKKNPKHPSLHFKKVGKFWSACVGINYRALAIEDQEDFIWVWIGTHDEYEHLIK